MESIKEKEIDNENKNLISILKEDLSGSASLVSAVVSASIFMTGGLFFFTYFVSIRYIPIFDFKESIFIFIAVSALGSFIFFGCLLGMFFPVLAWISCYSPEIEIKYKKKDFFWSYIAWLLEFIGIFLTFIGIVSNAINTCIGVAIILIGFMIIFCFTSFPSSQNSNLFKCFASSPSSQNSDLHKIIKHKIHIIWYGLQSVFIGLFSTFVLHFAFIGVERNFQPLNNINELIEILISLSFLCIIILVISILILYFWDDRKLFKGSKTIHYFAIVIVSSILIPYFTGGANAIPSVVMRNLRLGALVNSNIVINHKGCQIIEKIEPSMLSPQTTSNSTIAQPKQSNICSNKDTVYMISNIDIQVTLGDSLFLKYPSINSACDDSAKENKKKCVNRKENKFHLPKKYVLSYFVQGQDMSTNQP